MPLYVTDTHPLVWYAGGQHKRLSKQIIRVFQAADEDRTLVYVPVMVLWEIAMLIEKRRLQLKQSFDDWATMLFHRGFELVPVDLSVISEVRRLRFSRDPFDLSIVATARIKDVPLITKDVRIAESGMVEAVW